jgi:hypothetical protein
MHVPQCSPSCKDIVYDLPHIPSGAPREMLPSKGKEALAVNIYAYTLSSDPLPSGTLERCKPPTRRARSCKDSTRTYALLYCTPYPVVPLAVKIKALPRGAPCEAPNAKNPLAAKI